MVADDVSRWSFVGGTVPLEWEAGRGFMVVGSGVLETRAVDCTRGRLRVESSAPVDVEIPDVGTAAVITTAVDSRGATLEFPGCATESAAGGRYRVRVADAEATNRTIIRAYSL